MFGGDVEELRLQFNAADGGSSTLWYAQGSQGREWKKTSVDVVVQPNSWVSMSGHRVNDGPLLEWNISCDVTGILHEPYTPKLLCSFLLGYYFELIPTSWVALVVCQGKGKEWHYRPGQYPSVAGSMLSR